MGLRGTTSWIATLDTHPNRVEILGVLARLPHIADGDLQPLADGWHNSVFLADARDHALSPEAPLVLEVLAAFEAVQALFDDDVTGEADYVTVDPQVTTRALKAVRDAIAASYARPVLRRTEHAALMRAWRNVYPCPVGNEPDLGARHTEVKALLSALPRLAMRCHDDSSDRDFRRILAGSHRLDEAVRDQARSEAWNAAVLTSRRRLWTLVRRSGAEGLSRFCGSCKHRGSGDEASRVLALTLDAACALLVADAIDENLLDILTLPVADLIPAQRG